MEKISVNDFEYIRIYATMLIKLGINLDKGLELLDNYKVKYESMVESMMMANKTIKRLNTYQNSSRLSLSEKAIDG
jgi:hypothetical protein